MAALEPTIVLGKAFRARYRGTCLVSRYAVHPGEMVIAVEVEGHAGYALADVVTHTGVGLDRGWTSVARFCFTAQEVRDWVDAGNEVSFATSKGKVRRVTRATYGDQSLYQVDGKLPVAWKVVVSRVLRHARYAFPRGNRWVA